MKILRCARNDKLILFTHMQHIILIGFKNVGKTAVGRELAKALNVPFYDSDLVIQDLHKTEKSEMLSCREIMRNHGVDYFRELEHKALAQVLGEQPPAVISVGGGAPLAQKNQALMTPHHIVHVTAPKGVMYERIMLNGWPAFFPREVDPYISFQKILAERDPVYRQLAHHTIENNGSLAQTVSAAIQLFPQLQII